MMKRETSFLKKFTKMGTGYGKWNWENIKKRQFFLFIPILILAALVFQKTLNYNLLDIWDDQFNVTNNAKIKSITPQNLTTIFSSQHLAHYQPFKLLTYAFIYFISGDNPMPFHLTNLIFHLVNIILVFHLVYLLSNSRFTSFITGILFSVHPMFVETVCWVSGLNNILCAFFYILSLILYICYIKNGTKPKYLLLTFLFFICALLSKSLAVTLPLVLLVIDFYYNRRLNFRLIIEKIPFLVLSFLFGLIAILAAYNFGSVTDSQLIHRDGYNLVFFTSYALAVYIIKSVVPFSLCAVYYYPDTTSLYLPAQYYLSVIIVPLVIIAIIFNKQFKKYLVFGFLFFFITISVCLQFKQIGFIHMAERYTYIPYIGLFFIIAQVFNEIRYTLLVKWKALVNIVIISYVIVISFLAFNRTGYWESGVKLFTDVIEKQPGHGKSYRYRGISYAYNRKYREAISDFDMAQQLGSYDASMYEIRRRIIYMLPEIKEYIQRYDREIENNPTEGIYYYNRAVEKASDKIQDFFGAIEDYNSAINLGFKCFYVYYNRGNAKKQIHEYDEALSDYYQTIKLKPDFADAYNNRGIVKLSMSNYDASIKDFNMAIDLNPQFNKAYYNRGNARFYSGDYDGACEDWHIAMKTGNKMASKMIRKNCN